MLRFISVRDDTPQRIETQLGCPTLMPNTCAIVGLRAGLYTAFASTPEVDPTRSGQVQEAHIDIYGVTSSITRFNEGSAISIGLMGNYGSRMPGGYAPQTPKRGARFPANPKPGRDLWTEKGTTTTSFEMHCSPHMTKLVHGEL